ncbi:MAG: heme ABC exporter ATP-binding protein CcmA [Myxococcota bacterium]
MPADFSEVRAEGLVKVFGATRALAGVSLTLPAGAITSVEGPNGSGKSTLLAILAGLMRPTRGRVVYGNREARGGPAAAALRRRLGILGHRAMLYPDLTGRENLRLFARLYGLGDPDARIAALLRRFEIGAFVDRPARTWSRGQMQRVALARALLHEPRLLLLDEPTTGLDARGAAHLVDVLKAERSRGAILLLVTHDAPLAERLADRRVHLDRGRVVTGEAAA